MVQLQDAGYGGNDFTQLSFWDEEHYQQPVTLSDIRFSGLDYATHVLDLPKEERPRERLLEVGPEGLSIAELLSLILGSADLSLARRVIQECREVTEDFIVQLRHITAEELSTISGIGDAKAAAIIAAVELGKRLYQQRPQNGTIVDDPAVAMEAFSADLMWETQECFAVLFLDIKNRIISSKVMTVGSATETIAHPREIFGEAVRRRAAQIIVAHNHPSGSLEPSPQDLQLTKQLLKSGRILGLPVLDHLILANGDYVSLRVATSLWSEIPQEGVEDVTVHER